MYIINRLLLCLAIPSLGCAENLETILENEAIEDVVAMATGNHKELEDTAMPKTMRIGKILDWDWAPQKSEAPPIIGSARMLWPKVNLIGHCRTEDGAKVPAVRRKVFATIQEVLLPSLVPPDWPEKLLACKDIPTVGSRYGWVEAADKVIGQIKNEAVRLEIQDDGHFTGFLIVPSLPQQQGEKADGFALRILREVTTLPSGAKFRCKLLGVLGGRISLLDLLQIGEKGDEDGEKSHKADTLWYHNTDLWVHPKFVYIVVPARRGKAFNASSRHLEYPDRF